MKKLLAKIILLSVLSTGPILAVNYFVDPLQCFRSARWYAPVYDSNERVQSACLARSHKYSAVIMGSSHVENFDPAAFDAANADWRTIKLAVAASTLYEQRRLLDLAFASDQVTNVVWSLDTNILSGEPERVRDDIVPFPGHIYDPSFSNNLLLLFDPYITKHYAKMVAHRFFGMYDEFTDVRFLNNWSQLFTFSKARTLEAYRAVQSGKIAAIENDIVRSKTASVSTDNIDRNVLAVIRAHPEVHFSIHFPPYSILRFRELYEVESDKFAAELTLKEYLIAALLALPNVEVFDFQDVSAITHNLENYKDLSHFSPDVDTYIIESLISGRHRLSMNNSTSTLQSLRWQVENFDISLVE